MDLLVHNRLPSPYGTDGEGAKSQIFHYFPAGKEELGALMAQVGSTPGAAEVVTRLLAQWQAHVGQGIAGMQAAGRVRRSRIGLISPKTTSWLLAWRHPVGMLAARVRYRRPNNVYVLGLIVVIRAFLSFSLETEIEGVAPWRRALIGGAGTIRRASARAPGSDTPP